MVERFVNKGMVLDKERSLNQIQVNLCILPNYDEKYILAAKFI
jgi:hypothetical protein